MPRQSFTHAATSAADPESVWQALNLPTTWEAIAGVDRVREPVVAVDGSLRGFTFDTIVAGKSYVGTARPRERVEGRTMSWDIANQEVRGVTRVDLESSGSGTLITVTVDVESAGLMSRMFFPVIAATIGKGLPASVEEFAAALERDD